MKRFAFLLIAVAQVVASLTLLENRGYAAEYFVDQNHPSASDSNNGTASEPWLTIQHAAGTLNAGDQVWVRSGTYSEQVRPQRSGSAGNEISYSVYPGDTVTIDGSSIVLQPFEGLFDVFQTDYIRISGFRVVNSGPQDTSAGIQVEACKNVVVENNFTSNTASSGIIVWSSSNVIVNGNEVVQANSAGATSENECISVGETNGFEVRNNHVHDGTPTRGEGIVLKDGSSNGLVYGNHVHHVPDVGIYVDAWDKHTFNIDVFSNRVHDVDGDALSIGSEAGGLLENVRVYNNIAYKSRMNGISVHACCSDLAASHPLSNIQITNNTAWSNGSSGWGGGILHENMETTGLLIRNNIFSQNLSFQIALEGPDPGTVTADHNLVDGFRSYAGEIYGSDYQEGDPLFVSTPTDDFHLRSGSKAIDTGSAVDVPVDDYDGNQRPQGVGWDLGAFEHGDGGGGGGGPCQANAMTLCIDGSSTGDGRFQIEVDFETVQGGGSSGAGQAVPMRSLGIDRGGLFWFFNAANPEMLIKVLDGCAINGRFWVFYSAGTNVGLTVWITDTSTGAKWTDVNPDLRQAPPVADTEAFSCD